jgi:hypothetical protein
MIPPSMIHAMLRNPDETESSQATGDVERARANLEKAIEGAAVVSMDQETGTSGETNNSEETADQTTRIDLKYGLWIFVQFGFSVCTIVLGIISSCNDVDTLRTWSTVWGLSTLYANVIMPLRGSDMHSEATESTLFTAFGLLYVWGSSAVFPHWNNIEDKDCDEFLFWWSAWSLVCGMSVTASMIIAGMIMLAGRRCKGTVPKCNIRARP